MGFDLRCLLTKQCRDLNLWAANSREALMEYLYCSPPGQGTSFIKGQQLMSQEREVS